MRNQVENTSEANNYLHLRKFWGFNFSRRFVLMVLVGFVLTTLVHSIAATPAIAHRHSQVILISLDGATPRLVDKYLNMGQASSLSVGQVGYLTPQSEEIDSN